MEKYYLRMEDATVASAMEEYMDTHPDREEIDRFLRNVEKALDKLGALEIVVLMNVQYFFAGLCYGINHPDKVTKKAPDGAGK